MCASFSTVADGQTFHTNDVNTNLGALKATGNRGLQPAMDHILEHEGQPVPDLGGVVESSSGARSRDAMDVDDDEDADALKSLGAIANNAVEAKVCSRVLSMYKSSNSIEHQEHQMFRVWQDLPKYRVGELPCRKEWSRSI